MRIWIDADACPRPVRDIVFKRAEKKGIRVTLVANSFQRTPPVAWIDSVQVPKGMDEADHYIAAHVQPADLVITQDVPLAADVVGVGATAVSVRGELWTEDNVREHLSIRDFMTEARALGVTTAGPPPFDARARQTFANAFDRWLASSSGT